MMSLRKGKRGYGVFNPHVYELTPRLYSRYEYPRCADKYEWGIDSHVRDLRLPDLAIIVIDNSLQYV
jgi:hypothetical protein